MSVHYENTIKIADYYCVFRSSVFSINLVIPIGQPVVSQLNLGYSLLSMHMPIWDIDSVDENKKTGQVYAGD